MANDQRVDVGHLEQPSDTDEVQLEAEHRVKVADPSVPVVVGQAIRVPQLEALKREQTPHQRAAECAEQDPLLGILLEPPREANGQETAVREPVAHAAVATSDQVVLEQPLHGRVEAAAAVLEDPAAVGHGLVVQERGRAQRGAVHQEQEELVLVVQADLAVVANLAIEVDKPSGRTHVRTLYSENTDRRFAHGFVYGRIHESVDRNSWSSAHGISVQYRSNPRCFGHPVG